jgi:hypothetical protein
VETGNKSLEETAAVLDGVEIQERFVDEALKMVEKDGLDTKPGQATLVSEAAV